MICNFKIENFRLFDEVNIKKLNRINLIVGKNSSGKSAILEAFLFYFSKVSVDSLVDRIYSRQEHLDSRINKYTQPLKSNPVRHFFKNHTIPDLNECGFKLSSDKHILHVKSAVYIREDIDLGFVRKLLSKNELKDYNYDYSDIHLVLNENNVTKMLFPLEASFSNLKRRNARIAHDVNQTPIQFVPTGGISDLEAATLWDSISLTDLEDYVVDGIKLIEPSSSGITFVENTYSARDGRIPLIKLDNSKEPMPLKSLGDGMTRIFQIILSLVSAKDGVLIVDEFENGLHWSIQNSVWDMVFKLALKLNVQVFCSTHSRDCINSFEKIWNKNENKESASFMRLVKRNGISVVKEYDLELLSDSLETDVEVR